MSEMLNSYSTFELFSNHQGYQRGGVVMRASASLLVNLCLIPLASTKDFKNGIHHLLFNIQQ